MNFWLCVDKKKMSGFDEIEYNGTKETVNRCFNICHGLEPMKENVFEYVIVEILSTMFYGAEDYISVYYAPERTDRLSCVQADRAQIDEKYNTEIVVNDDSKRGFKIYSRKDMTLKETIRIFHEVLVEYKFPDLSGWDDVTEIVKYA